MNFIPFGVLLTLSLILNFAVLTEAVKEKRLDNVEDDLKLEAKRFKYHRTVLIPISGPSWSKRDRNERLAGLQKHTESQLRLSHDFKKRGKRVTSINHRNLNIRKRQGDTKHNATMELLLVIDHMIFLRYLEKYRDIEEAKLHIKEYYEHFVGYLSEIYQNAAESFSVTIKPVAIVLAMDFQASSWASTQRVYSKEKKEYVVPAVTSLEKFGSWLLRHKAKLPHFDHAMAITNTELYDPEEGNSDYTLRGMAWVGGMCKVGSKKMESTSIINDKGAFHGVLTAAHELGHSFGASHDGLHPYCPIAHHYLMSSMLPSSPDAARFSACSEFEIKQNFRMSKYKCLMDAKDESKTVASKHPGTHWDANELCEEWFGKEYHTCHLLATNDLYTPMCSRVVICGRKGVDLACDKMEAVPTGTPCARQSMCVGKRCVLDPQAPCCPLKHEDHAYCQRKMKESDENCKNPNMRFLCCRHCGIKCKK